MTFTVQAPKTDHGVSAITMYETSGGHNRVVHVIVPSAAPTRAGGKAGSPLKAGNVRAAAKKALLDAAASL